MFPQDQLAGHNRYSFSQETIDLARKAVTGGLGKATTTGIDLNTALVGYPLEAPSKKLYPVLSPIRNLLPRLPVTVLSVGGMAGTALNWKQITAINAGNLWPTVAAGARNSAIQYTEADKSASFKTFGLDDKVVDEAIWAGRGFEDARALSALATLQATMVAEERLLLGGNVTALGAPAGLAATASASGGSLATGTYRCIVSALTMQGWYQAAKGRTGGVDANGETDGSTNTSTAVTGPNGKLDLTWTAKRGAFAYNVFIDNGAGGAYAYHSTVFVNAATITSIAGVVANTPNTADKTANALDFDGLIPQIEAANAGYYSSLNNATLTADGAQGIVEIDTALQSLWDNQRVGPQRIWVNSQEINNIAKKLTNAGSSSLVRVVVENTVDAQGNLVAGIRAVKYINKYTGEVIDITVHPNMPPGKLMGLTHRLPEWYPNNNIPEAIIVCTLQEYADYEFARTDRSTPHGVYASEVLVCYAPAFSMVITNIKNG